MTNNISTIMAALQALDENLKQREKINTPFGKQSPAHGYEIKRIDFIRENHIRIDIVVNDRSIRERDCIRGGDEASFRILKEGVLSDEEYVKICE